MGGMALGSWLCSRYSGRWQNLLIGYAVAEGAIGRLAAGERERARALWRRYAPGLRTASRDPLPELLKGHLFGAHQGEGIWCCRVG